ncbi:MAG: HEAT repeat domain-containing protein [Pseudomonadota bacterium]
MKNALSILKSFIDQAPGIGLTNPIFLLVFWMNSSNLLAAQMPGLDVVSDSPSGSSGLFIIWFIVGIIILSVLIVTTFTWWSNKQDDISNMMTFCIQYLMETVNEGQKMEAARALGQVKDPGALLILVDIANDESAGGNLRKTADGALRELSRIYGKYVNVIDELLSAEEEKNHQQTIHVLISNFENRKTAYVQSAFVIGREFMRLKQYADAREWLQKAKIRNHKTVIYVHQISELIDICNEKLFFEGDVLFQLGDYHQALERYALASHDLRYAKKQRFASHLRLACVYCKLTHYKDAYQETLHALHDRHETDVSLKLNNLLKRQQGETGSTSEMDEKRKKILDDIDSYVTDAMIRLSDIRSMGPAAP